jgi:hypothetical protein
MCDFSGIEREKIDSSVGLPLDYTKFIELSLILPADRY